MPAHKPLQTPLDLVGNNDAAATLLPMKSFAEPFRLIFEKPSGEVSNIEVRSLGGLRSVTERLEKGEIREMNRFATLEMQLWGLLAERVGFLQRGAPQAGLSAGIMPLGPQATGFAEDMAPLFGGEINALNALADMTKKAQEARELVDPSARPVPEPSEHKFVKGDCVNLTPDGEKALASIVGANAIDMESDNAAHIMRQSEPGFTSEELDEIEEAGNLDEEIHGKASPSTGPLAAAIGMAVEAIRPVGIDGEGEREIYRRENDAWVKITLPALQVGDQFVMIDDGTTPPDEAAKWTATGTPAKNDDGLWQIQAKEVGSDAESGSSTAQDNPDEPDAKDDA